MKLFRKQNSGYWYFDHTFPNGSRVRKSTKKSDKYIARIWANDYIKQIEEKKKFLPKKGSFFAEYLLYARPRKGERTIVYEQRVWQRFTDFIKSEDPAAATEQNVEQFFTFLLTQKKIKNKKEVPVYRPATINGYHRIIRLLLNKAVRWKYCFANPVLGIEMMRFEPDPPRFLTLAEIHSFFTSAQKLYPHLVPLFMFYFLTGLRRSEAFHLEWTDVDFDRKLITVKKTKGKRPRFVPLTPLAERILRQRTGLQKPFSDDINKELGLNPGPIQRIRDAAGIAGISLQDLRRSFATYMAAHLSEKLLQQVLGHANYSVTDIFYIGTNAEHLRQKMIVLDRMLAQTNPN